MQVFWKKESRTKTPAPTETFISNHTINDHITITGDSNMAKTNKKLDNLEGVLDKIQSEHSKDLDTAFKLYDEHHSEDKQTEFFNKIFAPGMDAFYDKFTSELDKTFGDDKKTVFQKEKELKKVTVEGIKAYFKKVQPGMLKKALKGIDDVDEQFALLTSLYDQHHGVTDRQSAYDAQKRGYISLGDLVQSSVQDKKSSVGKIKRALYGTKGAHAQQGVIGLNQQATQKYFAGFHQIDLGEHIKDKWDLKYESAATYKQQGIGQLLGLHTSLREGGQINYQQHGLKYDKPKKEKKK